MARPESNYAQLRPTLCDAVMSELLHNSRRSDSELTRESCFCDVYIMTGTNLSSSMALLNLPTIAISLPQ